MADTTLCKRLGLPCDSCQWSTPLRCLSDSAFLSSHSGDEFGVASPSRALAPSLIYYAKERERIAALQMWLDELSTDTAVLESLEQRGAALGPAPGR
ncbi:unnamed protein product [Miscanthus lutarioriparius]|uniref:Uncharacterized protein n=1 Tax=Miscanthus lutarioriparius TaxID=422564 RepID=A0A811R0M7_9POAL|nr:unnamed protein product [Miscanthus lutarioriparius]